MAEAYTKFVHALADQFRETMTDHNDDPDSLTYGSPRASAIGGGSTEAAFMVKPDLDMLAEEQDPALVRELGKHDFIVRVQVLE